MIGIIACGACSALGVGPAAVHSGSLGEPAETRVAADDELQAAGLARPYVARARVMVVDPVDRATALLEHAMTECAHDLDEVLPGWRSLRVGAAIGTSSGGMRSFEQWFGAASTRRPSAHAATYVGPLIDAARPCAFEPVSLVLGACASSALALGLGRAWLLEDRCDVVLCGGFDAVSVFVAAGFECLRATCGPAGPRPFRTGRDGLALGEGAVVAALVRTTGAASGGTAPRIRAWVTGFGASCDAAHLTAPDRAGAGLARAGREALADAGEPTIELVSAHGTATPHNDAAEAAALVAILGGARVPVFSSKGTIGHTLGAAGALEVLLAVDALDRGVAPASVGEGPVDGGVHVLDRGQPSSARTALKLSAAFGGANAALVVSKDPPDGLAGRARSVEIHVSRAVAVTLEDTDAASLAARTGYGADRILRGDDLVRLTLAAVAALEDISGGPGSMRGAGIIVGHGLATIETNALFLARLDAAGAARAEPRRFPYTTPNAAAGECAVAFGLTGPSFAVGGGPHGGIEAIDVASSLVRSGVADRVVVVAVDASGPASEQLAPGTKSGAVAVLVGSSALGGAARLEQCTVRFEAAPKRVPSPLPPMDAHRALLPLALGRPTEVTAEVPWGGFARAKLFWL